MGEKICTIGPISLDNAHLLDNNEFKSDRSIELKGNIYTVKKVEPSEKFVIYGTNREIKQMIGLCKGKDIYWVDTSSELNLDSFRHRGWYVISMDDLELLGPEYAKLTIDARKISGESLEYFEQDYTLLTQLPYDYEAELPPGNPAGVNSPISETYYATYKDGSGYLKLDVATKTNRREPTYSNNYDPGSGYNVSWLRPEGIRYGNTTYAYTNTCTGPTNSYYLRASSFNAPIPTNTKVLGIQIKSRVYTNQPGHVKTYSVRFKTDVFSAVKSHSEADDTTWVYIDLGGSTDLWGSNSSVLTPTRVNASTLDIWGTLNSGHKWQLDNVYMYVYWLYAYGTYTRYHSVDATRNNWGQIQVTQTIPSGTNVLWDVYNANDNTLLLAGAGGTAININYLPHVNLKMVATLYGSGTTTPTVNSVTVTEV